ncbi:MAG: hypothetical protein ACQRW7_07320 [Caulobacterales bacterium]|uniref:hypothetical protein n=1 Tax=Glycocaulis sp. TaxID=1969725 RepID=UPI003FA130FB
MSEKQPGNPLIDTLRDGRVFTKIWRNEREGAEPIYNVTVGRLYADPETGETRESRSLSGSDILKAQALLGEAYRTVSQLRTHIRENDGEPQRGLEAQRDAARASAPGKGNGAPDRPPSRRHQPEQ